jgi:hypothetical protein
VWKRFDVVPEKNFQPGVIDFDSRSTLKVEAQQAPPITAIGRKETA